MAERLLLVGCGNMGRAMLAGWLAKGVAAADVAVLETGAAAADAARGLGAAVAADVEGLPAGFAPDVVVLAVKPQSMAEVAAPLVRFAGAGGENPGAVFLSIAAGKTIASFESLFGAGAAVVRSMPNTPAAIGRGMIVACANRHVAPDRRQLCERLLAAVGEVAWVEDEALMDAVTAVSGSGPAYVFLLIESLAAAGVEAGLPQALATRLALATVAGSAELAVRAGEPAAELRRRVTSPGGTTQAALEVLMAEDGLPPLLGRAVAAAARRSRELAG